MARGKSRAIVSESDAFRIEGLSDFVRTLRAISSDLGDEAKDANYDLAKDLVRRSKNKARRHSRLANKAAKSLRAGRAATSAIVAGGGPRWPFFYGAEFGAKRYRQFDAWRGNQWMAWAGGPGYFLHPTIRDESPELLERYMDQIIDLVKRAFPD